MIVVKLNGLCCVFDEEKKITRMPILFDPFKPQTKDDCTIKFNKKKPNKNKRFPYRIERSIDTLLPYRCHQRTLHVHCDSGERNRRETSNWCHQRRDLSTLQSNSYQRAYNSIHIQPHLNID